MTQRDLINHESKFNYENEQTMSVRVNIRSGLPKNIDAIRLSMLQLTVTVGVVRL
jgi:hypothetical protein